MPRNRTNKLQCQYKGTKHSERRDHDSHLPSNNVQHTFDRRNKHVRDVKYPANVDNTERTRNMETGQEALRNTDAAHQCTNTLEIPGFYYDAEKKRYFKIAPNHATGSCNYTKDAISQKEAETKRLNDVSNMISQTKTLVRTKNRFNTNVLNIIQNMSVHECNRNALRNRFLRNVVTNLQPVHSQPVLERNYFNSYDNLEHVSIMHMGSEHDEMIGLWSVKDCWMQRILHVKLVEGARSEQWASLSVIALPQFQNIMRIAEKVTDLCWAPWLGDKSYILYTTMCHMGYQESRAIIKSVNPNADPSSSQVFGLERKAIWACAWNSSKCQLGIGSEKCALVFNMERRMLFECNTDRSDPLSLGFSSQMGNSMYAGTRNGQILTYDMRSKSTFPVISLPHKSPVCSVNPLQNDTHLLAADFSGKICLWDLRQRKVVVEYLGNFNCYSRIPVHIDETETTVYTVGQDGYTRFWNLPLGTHLNTIPPPCPVSMMTIPCVQLSSRWGNREGNSGLIMGLNEKLYCYGSL